MRLNLSLLAALIALTALAACGTRTPLLMPPVVQPVPKPAPPALAPAPAPALDNSNKAAEPRQ